MGRLIKLPYFHQHTNHTCGPACLKMVFAFFGKRLPEKKLARLSKTNFDGTKHSKMISLARKEGFYCYVHENASLNQIKHFIDLKIPVIINYIEPSEEDAHFSVIVGYEKNFLILDDPWNGKNFKIDSKEFEKRWHGKDRCKNWILVVSKDQFDIGKQYNPLK